ncbi:MAG: 1-deoxy-D-xylulose-5-phosphate synthase [Bacteroidia bacterium]
MAGLLEHISCPQDVRSLSQDDLDRLSQELRSFLISSILENGGHFAANLGVVELTVALHHYLDFERDKLVFDVGHQSYAHKVLSGRKDQLPSIRSWGGLSGFPALHESPYDHFGTGHSSTALSAIMGLAHSAHLLKRPGKFVAVIGDGAFTGGMMYEALNNLVQCPMPVWIILNDNQMGIDPNTGALNQHLTQQDSAIREWSDWFHLDYSGPIDGHSVQAILNALASPSQGHRHRLIHIRTVKGKGYEPAEKEQTRWHATAKFVKIDSHTEGPRKSKWQDLFGKMLLNEAARHSDLVGISPAMPSSCGMAAAFEKYPDRFFDTGIAEQHSVTFAAGLALGGNRVVLNIYSTFLQRAMDQWVHDVALQNIGLTLCIDRAGLVGEDGPTHHGAFDLNWLLPVPHMHIATPGNAQELQQALRLSLERRMLSAIRYPKGEADADHFHDWEPHPHPFEPLCLHPGSEWAICSCGPISFELQHALQQQNLPIALYHFPWVRTAQGLIEMPKDLAGFSLIATVEDGALQGGWGHSLRALQSQSSAQWLHFGIGDAFVSQGPISTLRQQNGYDVASILDRLSHL